jgi:ankyrin repeat protein
MSNKEDLLYCGWFWISKSKENSDNASFRFNHENFKKRKKRWIEVTKTTMCYCHSKPKSESDKKYVQLRGHKPLLGFNEVDRPIRIYLVDSKSQLISVVFEPDSLTEDLTKFNGLILKVIKNIIICESTDHIDNNNSLALKALLLDTSDATEILSDIQYSEVGNAIHYASSTTSSECLSCLLSHYGVNSIYLKNMQSNLAIHIASQYARVENIKIICQYGFEYNLVKKNIVNLIGYRNQTPLHMSTDEEVTALLLKYGADIEASDIDGYAPLLTQVKGGHILSVIELLDSGAKVNSIAWKTGETAVMLAVSTSHSESIEMEDQNSKDILNSSDEVILELIDRNADISVVDNMNKSALHYACKHGNLPSAILLINAGADVNLQDINGTTPICYAAEYHNFLVSRELVALLLARGAYPKIRDYQGRQVLHYAACKSQYII